ncbi:MAG: hypothetical protein C0501_27640 [Isosphaera sp.]|nr:hypothetical protein [Isosphaera sp.]
MRTGDIAGAAADFTRALDLNPNHLAARVNRSAARVQLGDLDGALADANQALVADPKHRDASANRATARVLRRDFAGAVTDAETVLAADPNSIEGLYIRGTARTGLEQFADALRDLDQVVAKAPTLAAGWAARGNARYHAGHPGAMDDYRQAFQLDPASATRVVLRLIREQTTHRPAEVLAECQKFRAKNRTDVISLARRGVTRLLQGRTADASLDFALFRKLSPADAAILDALIAAAKATPVKG